MTTALSIIRTAAAELGIPVGTSIASTDMTMQRMVALLNRTGKNLRRQALWPELQKTSFVTMLTDQARYSLPADFDVWANNTAWNASEDYWAVGPVTPSEQSYIDNSTVFSSIDLYYRITGISKSLQISPTPSATTPGDFPFSYYSTNWLRPGTEWAEGIAVASGAYLYYDDYIMQATSSGTAGSTAPSPTAPHPFTFNDGVVTYVEVSYDEILANDDEVVLDEELLTMGLLYRLLDGKGIEANKYELEYNKILRDRLGQILGARRLYTASLKDNFLASKERNMPNRIEV